MKKQKENIIEIQEEVTISQDNETIFLEKGDRIEIIESSNNVLVRNMADVFIEWMKNHYTGNPYKGISGDFNASSFGDFLGEALIDAIEQVDTNLFDVDKDNLFGSMLKHLNRY